MINNSNITLISGFEFDLIQEVGSDQIICQAARVSTKGADAFGTDESAGLMNFLMAGRHGSPFEHGLMSFRITAPIFVWREFMRHRIGFSYNEQSGRYMELLPVFYIPPTDRPLVQIGKAGHYTLIGGTQAQHEFCVESSTTAYLAAWKSYKEQLGRGIAKEVAREVLPVATYSSAYVTCNPRSMMSFLSLRTKDEDSMFPSYPQWEIEQVALKMEAVFKELYPLAYEAFNANGRVSP
ncbi:thymidylate synthase [Rhodococcus phage ReqiPoco6]|uniref:Gp090 n=1 Tax=Rhodococcus phage ReqiPoco6 TaxID=691964 RepID=D4P7V8_9CAUD|nr:thymidylate synthase [Rhodococcus phage ReqiPoco6]ADD81088.1 gp090 [Rhodococcus phage ReqiPoco6]